MDVADNALNVQIIYKSYTHSRFYFKLLTSIYLFVTWATVSHIRKRNVKITLFKYTIFPSSQADISYK